MATKRLLITFRSNKSDADVNNFLGNADQPGLRVKKLGQLLQSAPMGTYITTVDEEDSPTAATQTVTCDQASAVAATDELTIGSFSCASVSSGADASAGEWELGADDDAMATNLAAAINGATSLKGVVTASANAAVVTITAAELGSMGNEIVLSETGNGLTLGGAKLAGGTGGDASADITTYTFGA